MRKKIVLEEKFDAEIYPNETFWMDIERLDGGDFEDTNTFEVEIRSSTNSTIKTVLMQRSVDKKIFEVRFFDTDGWKIGQKYKLLGRLKDTNSLMNDVVLEVAFLVI